MVYVSDAPAAAEAWDLRTTDSGANVILAEPKFGVVFDRTVINPSDIVVAAPTRAVVDLMTGPGREPVEAEELLGWMQRNEQSWRVCDLLTRARQRSSTRCMHSARTRNRSSSELMSAEFDHLRGDAEAYTDALHRAGVEVHHERLLGHTHSSPGLTRLVRSSFVHEQRAIAALRARLHG